MSDDAAKLPVHDLVHSVIVHPVSSGEPMKVEIIGQLSALTGDRPALLMVAGAGFRRQDYAGAEIKDIFGSSQMAAVYSKPRFISIAWDIGPRAAAA